MDDNGGRTPTRKRVSQDDIAYWMGKVDGKLEELSRQMGNVLERMDDIEERERSAKKNGNGSNNGNGTAKADGNQVTFTWILEKAGLPLGLGFMYWFLFTVLPNILKGAP